MADDTTGDEPGTPAASDLGDSGKKALDEERKARRDAERMLKELQGQMKELEDKDKSETDKLRDQLATITKERDDALSESLRLQVAAEKGLTPAQAKRLVGTSREELEADASEILEAFPVKGATPPPSTKPAADLKGGGEPDTDPVETDPAKLAESVPRL